MSIVDTLKSSWSGPGKKWVIGGAVLGLGYLWWTRVRDATPSTGDATISPGGAAVADPVTPAGGDYTPTTSTTRPQTNGEWLAYVTARLQLPPYNRPAIATFNALTKALGGEPLTTAEASIVEIALQVGGTPPEGMPKLNISAPTTGGTTTTPTPAPKPKPTPTAASYTVRAGDTLTKIGLMWGNTWRQVYDKNAATIESAAKQHGHTSSRGGPTNNVGWWIFAGTKLYKP